MGVGAQMNVIIACEFSCVVRDAFRARGHDAWSCDILPAERGQNWHMQGDALRAIQSRSWGLMIAHPPCTYLANSGARWLYKGGRGRERDNARWRAMLDAAAFYRALADAPIARIAIENPVMHRYGREAIGLDWPIQTIQPWQFGHGEVKATCLQLKGLPPLRPTKIVSGRVARVHRAPPSPDRWKDRSRTLRGIADAMADQWGNL